mmetsp:Transcript_74660/g.118686  ORF Transcript_74660/g.118686 Transcript_74660/m.118686 type:complete len:235 (+) Transcript_74660:260-964(+)
MARCSRHTRAIIQSLSHSPKRATCLRRTPSRRKHLQKPLRRSTIAMHLLCSLLRPFPCCSVLCFRVLPQIPNTPGNNALLEQLPTTLGPNRICSQSHALGQGNRSLEPQLNARNVSRHSLQKIKHISTGHKVSPSLQIHTKSEPLLRHALTTTARCARLNDLLHDTPSLHLRLQQLLLDPRLLIRCNPNGNNLLLGHWLHRHWKPQLLPKVIPKPSNVHLTKQCHQIFCSPSQR